MSTYEFTQSFFDASSKAWKKNKVRYGEASYHYKKDAFPNDPELPCPPKQSRASKLITKRELEKRQSLDEEAPLPPRRSQRLRGRR